MLTKGKKLISNAQLHAQKYCYATKLNVKKIDQLRMGKFFPEQ